VVAGLGNIVRQVDEQLSKAPLGRCIIAEDVGEGSISQRLREALTQRLSGSSIVTEPVAGCQPACNKVTSPRRNLPKEAPDHVFQKTGGLLLDELSNHIAQNSTNSVEPLVCGADVVEPAVIQENLLHDEYRHRLAKFRSGLHDAQAERDDLSGEEEVDDLGGVVLNKRANDPQRGESKVFKRPRFGRGVEERVEEQRDVRWERIVRSEKPLLGEGRAQGILPLRKRFRVSLCDATHCSKASALHTLLEAAAVSCEGFRRV
jgi:hypothetical protein